MCINMFRNLHHVCLNVTDTFMLCKRHSVKDKPQISKGELLLRICH